MKGKPLAEIRANWDRSCAELCTVGFEYHPGWQSSGHLLQHFIILIVKICFLTSDQNFSHCKFCLLPLSLSLYTSEFLSLFPVCSTRYMDTAIRSFFNLLFLRLNISIFSDSFSYTMGLSPVSTFIVPHWTCHCMSVSFLYQGAET